MGYQKRGGTRGRGGDYPRNVDRGGRGRGSRGTNVVPRGFPAFPRGSGRGVPQSRVFSTPDNATPVPSSKVTEQENSLSAQYTKEIELPFRPGYGTKGRPVTLWTNYYELALDPKLVLYRYFIDLIQNHAGEGSNGASKVSREKRAQIIKLMLQNPEYTPIRGFIVTDFSSTLISCKKLEGSHSRAVVTYKAENEDEPPRNAQTFQLKIEMTGSLTAAELTAYLTSSRVDETNLTDPVIVQMLNIIVNYYSNASSKVVSTMNKTSGSARSFVLDQQAFGQNLEGGLLALRGFLSSVRVATSRILVNVNVSHAAFYHSENLASLIRSSRIGNPQTLASFLKKLKVRLIHLPERKNNAGETIPRIKTIIGLATVADGNKLDKPPRVNRFGAGPTEVQFFLDADHVKTGPNSRNVFKTGYVSVMSYFQNQYNRACDPNMPVVNVGTAGYPSYLPVEVCEVVPGQSFKSKLSSIQTQKMIKFAARKPWENLQFISGEGRQTIGFTSKNETLLRFGLTVNEDLVTVPGRVLEPPRIKYQSQRLLEVRAGRWNMSGIKVHTGTRLRKWIAVMFCFDAGTFAHNFEAEMKPIVEEFYRALETIGIDAAAPIESVVIRIQKPEDPKIERIIQRAAQNAELLFVILPDKDSRLYSQIKKFGDVKYGIHTACVVGRDCLQGDPQRFANVAIKVNLKLGGINHILEPAQYGFISEGKTMVIGIDVTHPSPGSSQGAPSIAAMVASIDKYLAQWPADIRIQKGRQEVVSALDEMLQSRLQAWKSRGGNAALPENLLIYRDGVGEGMYDTVLHEEVPLLRKYCAAVYPASDTKKGLPRISVIIVAKRHHTRFYPTDAKDADRSSNCPSGTIVDRGITQARNWDFFLQSHAALQGTARPTHYYVILDEIFRQRSVPERFKNPADVLEALTHNLSHLFGRATKAVSICPPAYYADIACERARCYLSGIFDGSQSSVEWETWNRATQVHGRLQDSMYYI